MDIKSESNSLDFLNTNNEKVIEKSKLDLFEKNLKNADFMKKKIKEIIDSVIEELIEKIKTIRNLEQTFFESLEAEIKMSKFLYEIYQQEIKNRNVNCFISKELANHINFFIPELKIDNTTSLNERINNIIFYVNENINNKFQKFEKEEKIINIKYQINTKIKMNIKGIFNYNENLLVTYDDYTIKFIAKNTLQNKFTIMETEIKNIKRCKKKNEEDIIFILALSYIFIIKIFLQYDEYKILEKVDISKYDTVIINSICDLLAFKKINYSSFEFYLINYKNYIKIEKEFKDDISRFLLVNDNLFFGIKNYYIKLYLIEKNVCYEINKFEISGVKENDSVINLNEDYLTLNTSNKIFIFDKKNNYNLSKTINLNDEYGSSINIINLNNIMISLCLKEKKMKIVNYNISLMGLKWREISNSNIDFDNEVIKVCEKLGENHLFIIGENYCYIVEMLIIHNN